MEQIQAYVAWDQGAEEGHVFPAALTRQKSGELSTWNGFMSPEFDRLTAERLVRVNDSMIEELGRYAADAFRWYGDVLVERWAGHKTEVEWPETLEGLEEPFSIVTRTLNGRYPIGAWAWTWDVVPDLPHDFLSRADAGRREAEGVSQEACNFCEKSPTYPIHPFR